MMVMTRMTRMAIDPLYVRAKSTRRVDSVKNARLL
jgi:hypothetical protein